MSKSTSQIPQNIIPEDDELRLSHLKRYKIFHLFPAAHFNRVTNLAALMFNASGAYISFVDEQHVFYKAGTKALKTETVPREHSLCSIAIHHNEVTVFFDTHDFPHFLANPFCNNADGESIRFYAGAPLITPEGTKIGTLCVTDNEPRLVTERQVEMLAALSFILMDELDLMMQVSLLKSDA